MLRSHNLRFLVLAAMPLAFAPFAKAQQSLTGAFTAAQASAGRDAYQQRCASCHLPDLRGSNEAPPLAGPNFTNTWLNRSTADLFNKIHDTMPVSNPGTLSEQDALNLTAFILQSNGVAAGSCVGVHRHIHHRRPAREPRCCRFGPSSGGRLPARPARASGLPAGVTVEGEVKNYVPVTDDMLLHPNPADWLMVRGNYQAWNHSALTQITPQNVGICGSPGSGR